MARRVVKNAPSPRNFSKISRWRSAIERPRRAGIRHSAALVGRLHAAVGRCNPPRDAAPKLIENRKLANAPRDQLELLAILPIERVLHSGQLEEKLLEAVVEQHRGRDSLIGIDAEERKRRAKSPVALQQFGRDVAEPVESIPEGLKIAAEIAVEKRSQLPQIRPDELLGKNQNVILQQTEKLQRALFFAVEDRRRSVR